MKSEERIKVLTGVRRCGKSSIMELVRRQLLAEGVSAQNLLFLNLDNGSYNKDGIPQTEEREYRPLETIPDNYPKYVLTMDHLLQQRNGIINLNLIDFFLEQKRF